MSISAVTFDYWQTLVVPHDELARQARLASWGEAFARNDQPVAADRLEAAFAAVYVIHDENWRSGGPHFSLERFARELIDTLRYVPTDELVDACVEAQITAAASRELELAPGVAGVLRRLAAGSVRLGIVCDVGLTPSSVLRDHLERHDVLSYFDAVAFSDEVGVYKPDARMFAHALDGLDSVAAQSAHIGDLRHTDVKGARAFGMTAVRYAGVGDDDGTEYGAADIEADVVVYHHDQVPRALGLSD